MLHSHSDHQATLIIRSQAAGLFTAEGREFAEFGYRVSGDGIPRHDGAWATWIWDGTELLVRNDRFGFVPIYYAPIGTGFGVSTSAVTLIQAGADPTLNDEAVAVFLRLGYYVGDDTPFQSVRLLPPGSTLRWSNGTFCITSEPHGIPSTVSKLSRDQAVREYGLRFQHVVESMLPDDDGSMCVPLSAGRDSRHILYALVRAGHIPDMVVTAKSAPPRPSTDALIASKITKELRLPHTIVEQSDDRFEDELAKDLLTSFCADEHAQMIPVARWMNQQQFRYSWDGIAGDIFSCGVYEDDRMLQHFRNHEFDALSEWLLAEEGYLGQCLAPDYRERWNRHLAIRRLSRELAPYADLPNPAAPFFFYNRVRRELALCPFAMLNQKVTVLAPYLSQNIFDLLIDLPYDYFRGRHFHSEAIDRFYPELPRQEYISTSTGFVPEKRSRIWTFARRMGGMALNGLSERSCIRRRFLIPRLAKALVNRDFGTQVPVLFSRILVMLHLENAGLF